MRGANGTNADGDWGGIVTVLSETWCGRWGQVRAGTELQFGPVRPCAARPRAEGPSRGYARGSAWRLRGERERVLLSQADLGDDRIGQGGVGGLVAFDGFPADDVD